MSTAPHGPGVGGQGGAGPEELLTGQHPETEGHRLALKRTVPAPPKAPAIPSELPPQPAEPGRAGTPRLAPPLPPTLGEPPAPAEAVGLPPGPDRTPSPQAAPGSSHHLARAQLPPPARQQRKPPPPPPHWAAHPTAPARRRPRLPLPSGQSAPLSQLGGERHPPTGSGKVQGPRGAARVARRRRGGREGSRARAAAPRDAPASHPAVPCPAPSPWRRGPARPRSHGNGAGRGGAACKRRGGVSSGTVCQLRRPREERAGTRGIPFLSG